MMHPSERGRRCVGCGQAAQWVNDDGDAYCDLHGHPDPWGPGGKFIESGLHRVEPEDAAETVCDIHYETDDDR